MSQYLMASRNATLARRRYETADAVHSSSIRLLRLLRLQDKASRVGPAQLSALSVLVFGGSYSLSELAAIEQVKVPTMSRIVAGLERSGFLQRTSVPGDRRKLILTPTVAGIRTMRAGRRRRVDYLAAKLKSLDPAQLKLLQDAAWLIRRLIETTH
jgi:DNA-binding MarR family transcriptional regulator